MFLLNRKKARNQLLSSQRISDEDFIKALEIDCNDRRIAFSTREVFADICGIPKENITPETNFKVLVSAMKSGLLRGWDRMDFIFRLEKKLKIGIILPQDVFSSLNSIDFDCITFELVLLELLNKIEIYK